MELTNHKQVLSAYDRDGILLEQVAVDGWDDETNWSVDLDTDDNDLYRDEDGEGEFDWSHSETVHSALFSEKVCAVTYNDRYVGRYVHTYECELKQ